MAGRTSAGADTFWPKAPFAVAGGVFYGLGDPPAEDPQMATEASEQTSETGQGRQRTPLIMIMPAAMLVVAALVIGLVPHLGQVIEAAAVRFQDEPGYNATVLSGAHLTHPVALHPAEPAVVTVSSVLTAVGSAAGSVVLALLALYARRLPRLLRPRPEPAAVLVQSARTLQSGVINDYVTWLVVGLACIGVVLALAIR
jgi:NADH:ubiquinone oxidoreductase subunit 5 (subunit L)/multisubunit Na+/H+ antiporter MnhA subunit